MRLFLDHFTISLQIVALTPSYKFSLSPSNISKQGLEFGSDMSFLVSQDFGRLDFQPFCEPALEDNTPDSQNG